MKKYTVEWYGIGIPRITHVIKADAENDAHEKAMEQYHYPEYPDMRVWLDEEEYKQFYNKHYDPGQPITSSPQSSAWATLYRVCGGIILVIGFIGTIAVAQKNEEAGFQLAVMAIALTLTCFLAAFLIDVLTDMRHYLKAIAEKE